MIAQFAQTLGEKKSIDCIDPGIEGEGNWQKGSEELSNLHVFLTPLFLANDTHIQTDFHESCTCGKMEPSSSCVLI